MNRLKMGQWMMGLAAMAVTALSATQAQADYVLKIQNGSNGVGSDSTVFFAGTYAGTANTSMLRYNGYDYGGEVNIHVGYNGSSYYRAVLRFDLSSVQSYLATHPEVTITGATLTLYQATSGAAGTALVNASALTDANAGWGVGVGNGTAGGGGPIAGAATWFNKNADGSGTPSTTAGTAGTAWSGGTGGGTIGTTLASLAFDQAQAVGTAYTLNFDPTGTLVQHWLTGTNAGLLLAPGDTSSIHPYFYGSKWGSSSNYRKPELNITYTVIPEPASLGLFAIGSLLMFRRRR